MSMPSGVDGVRAPAQRLEGLTSLRFFAAMLIVVGHWEGMLGVPSPFPVNYVQGVSFFFVLSGFILAHVYPELGDATEVRAFWRARIARIWPAHIATLVLGWALVGYAWDPATLLANVALVHAWIPAWGYFFGYNLVSWSISTELGFYLAFPWLVRRWDTTWRHKVALAVAVLVALLAVAVWLDLPAAVNATDPRTRFDVSSVGLTFVNPLARMLEFLLGIAVAKAWARRSARVDSTGAAVAWELGALVLCAAAMVATADPRAWAPALHPAVARWISDAGAAPAFALLIHRVAVGSGPLARALKARVLVQLGEISYSLYLVHLIVLIHYRRHLRELLYWPEPMQAVLLLALTLLASYALWRGVEMPARRLLAGRPAVHAPEGWRILRMPDRRLWVAVAAIAATYALLRWHP